MAGSSFLDACRFTPTAGGTTDWTYSAAVVGYRSPSAAGAVNGAQYSYRAESSDLTQWEIGQGTYNTGTGVLARTTVLCNSSGNTSKINFTTTPQVAIVMLAEDVASLAGTNVFAGANSFSSAISPTAVPSAAWGIDFSGAGQISIPASSHYTLATGSGLVGLTDSAISGQTGLYVIGGSLTSSAALLAGGSDFVAPTTTPASGKYSVGFDGTNWNIYNGNTTTTVTFFVMLIRIRNTD
jgi:hypothetical protein